MKKIILAMVAIVAVATTITSCKKEESSNTSNTSSNSIVGTWGTTRLETYLTANDQKINDTTLTDWLIATFNANGTYNMTFDGDTTAETGTYSLVDKNGKKYLNLLESNDTSATPIQIENITTASFNLNTKEGAIEDGELEYEKWYFKKK